MSVTPRLLALSDLHVAFQENRKIVEDLRPESEGDWLLLAGDIGELSPDSYETGIVCSDEALLHPDPYPSREDSCWARVEATERRLAARDPTLPVIFVTHYPLIREPTRVLRHPQFAQWCGTTLTHDWHVRFNTAAVVHGHLHIPWVTWHEGVRFEEVSIGYPREWQRRARRPGVPRHILPVPEDGGKPR